MHQPILRLNGISKYFGMTKALTDMSITLNSGEVHAIVGENGAGKSTIIKIMTGIYQPTSGTIELDGKASLITGPQAAREAGIAAIYQEPMVFPDLDVAENIFISDNSNGVLMRPSEQRKRASAY